MELSPRQRIAVFIGVVIALAALGYYLVVPAVNHRSANAGASTPASTPSAAAPATTTQAPPVQASAAAAGGPDIYAWLPFTQQNLAAAASVAVRFGVDYNTFTYTESATDYVGAMGDLVIRARHRKGCSVCGYERVEVRWGNPPSVTSSIRPGARDSMATRRPFG